VLRRELARLPIGPAAQHVAAAVERVLTTGRPERVTDAPYVLSGGEERRAVMRVVPLRNAAGGVTGAIGTLRPGDGARPD
jgi:hypothetical protein